MNSALKQWCMRMTLPVFVFALPAIAEGAEQDGVQPANAATAHAITRGEQCEPEWVPLFGGTAGINNNVRALKVFESGSGPALYAGGLFTTAGGVEVNHIARWDGVAWTDLRLGMTGLQNTAVSAMAVHDDGGGQALYAAGFFQTAGGVSATNIARWDGAAWSRLGAGLGVAVSALAVFDDGTGPALYAGGSFTTAGGQPASRIAKWDGVAWSPVGGGVSGGANTGDVVQIVALTVFDDGDGPALYVGGDFAMAGGVEATHIAKWDGAEWSAVGGGLNQYVFAMEVFDDGSGPALYVAGQFTEAGGMAISRIAKWDGIEWSPVGGGTNSGIFSLTVFDDGSGPALYAGGGFTTAGGLTANRIAKWDGVAWSPLGSGMGPAIVLALAPFDDGSGPALFAGGSFFTAGDLPATRIAKWQGCALDCPGDTNGDGVVNFADLDAALSNFGQTVAPNTSGDLTGNGLVTFADLNEVLTAFGSACE